MSGTSHSTSDTGTVRLEAARERGYNLVALTVIVAVMTIFLGMALPNWEQRLQRQREEEAIFRGLQYAEAIRVFQLRQGRLPVTLDELLEAEPRSIRQLWKDPLTEDGAWGMVRGSDLTGAGEGAGGGDEEEEGGGSGDEGDDLEEGDAEEDPDFGVFEEEDEEGEGDGLPGPFRTGDSTFGQAGGEAAAAVGPIGGVFSKAKGAAIILFLGEEVYKDWRFTPEILPKPVVSADGEILSRANAAFVGRPFLYGLAPAGLSALTDEDLTPSGGATDVFGDEEEGEEEEDSDFGVFGDDDESEGRGFGEDDGGFADG